MAKRESQETRIEKLVGDAEEADSDEARKKFFDHLKTTLQLPCEVTGREDFNWEEYYVIGPGDPKEHEQLRQNQPSFRDIFELLEIKDDIASQWMLFHDEDLAAHVRRRADGKAFYLGLSEIKATDRSSDNYQLLDDYAYWLTNYR